MVEVAAGIIRDEEGRILVCQRGAGDSCAFLWEFPGGKREAGETMEGCLIRECKEELDVDIQILGVFATTTYKYPDKEIAFSFFDARIIAGVPKKTVHLHVQWVYARELGNFEFCPADTAIVKRIMSG